MRKELLKNVAAPLRKHGRFESLLKITRLRGQDPSVKHQVIVPHATYSPWWTDDAFQSVFAQVRESTFVDVYRLYELWSLVEQVKEIEGDILEVGVWRGGSGCLMAAKADRERLDAEVYLCDTFEGVVKAGPRDNEYRGGEHADTSPALVERLISRMGLKHVVVCQGVFPEETADRVATNALRLCHIDVDVYESARSIFNWAWDRLSPGGVVVFDDYGFYSCEGVTKFVNETARRPDVVFVHNLNGHAIVVKR
jgi:O-methyltransferase